MFRPFLVCIGNIWRSSHVHKLIKSAVTTIVRDRYLRRGAERTVSRAQRRRSGLADYEEQVSSCHSPVRR